MRKLNAKVRMSSELYKLLSIKYKGELTLMGYQDANYKELYGDNEHWINLTEDIKNLYSVRRDIEMDILNKKIKNN